MIKKLEGKTAVITGAIRPIGMVDVIRSSTYAGCRFASGVLIGNVSLNSRNVDKASR